MSTRDARPTVYNGVHMRSRLEAYAAQVFDQAGQAWLYEPRCFANETGQYLPDFFLPNPPEARVGSGDYVEVKPSSFHAAHRDSLSASADSLQRRMEIIYASDPRAVLIIWFPELRESYVSGWWEPRQWYHQGPTRFDLVEQVIARNPSLGRSRFTPTDGGC